jgi:hypothetical protein
LGCKAESGKEGLSRSSADMVPCGLGTHITKPDVVPVIAGTFSSCNQCPK